MAATISWVDAIGAASLSNIVQIPVDRFDAWQPDVDSVGDVAIALGTGQRYVFEYRVDDLVSFRIDNLRGSQLTYMRRLKLHLLRGGEVTVSAVNELAVELFTTCILAPDTRPEISPPNRDREYTFTVTLKSGAAPVSLWPGGGSGDELFGDVPGLEWRYWGDAMLLRGHLEGELLPQVVDETGNGNDAFPTSAGFEPVLSTDTHSGMGFNGHAYFNLTGSKAAQTATEFITPTAGCTVIMILRRTGNHFEHGVWWSFITAGGGGAARLEESNNFGTGFDQNDKLQVVEAPAYYFNVLDTETVIVAVRYSNTGTAEFFANAVLQTIYTQGGVAGGTSWNPGTDLDSPVSFRMGNGILLSGGNGLDGITPEVLGWGRALSSGEILTVTNRLAAYYEAGPWYPPGGTPSKDVSVVAASSVNDGGSASATIVQSVPIGTENGHLLVWAVHINAVLGSVPWPAGWTEEKRVTSSVHNGTLAVATKTTSSEPASYTMTLAGAQLFVSTMLAVDSAGDLPPTVDGSDSFDEAGHAGYEPSNASPWNFRCPSLAAAHELDRILFFAAIDNSSAQTGIAYAVNFPTYGWNIVTTAENTNFCSLAVAQTWQGPHGPTGNQAFVTGTGTGSGGRMTIGLALYGP